MSSTILFSFGSAGGGGAAADDDAAAASVASHRDGPAKVRALYMRACKCERGECGGKWGGRSVC